MANSVPMDKILVIDDELGPRESLRILLKKEFEVTCASSVDEGLDILREKQPEAVVLDVRMPEKSGIDGLREIRDIDPSVSVIMLTGYATLQTAQEALRLGANDYVKKPFDTKEMVDVIRRNVERTQVERKRFRTAQGLEELNEHLVDQLAKMEDMASLGQASAELLHDLRNPLTIVLGYVEFLSKNLQSAKDALGKDYEETLKFLDIIADNAARCDELARMWQRSGKEGWSEIVPVSVADLMEEIQASIEFLASHEEASVEYDLQARGVVMASRPQVLRAIHNVVANAMHALAETGGRIRIATRTLDQEIMIEVQDNGCGISPDDMEKIFQPYFTTKEEGKGTGLGLAITKKIIEAYGGWVNVSSIPGEGTLVSLRLPVAPEDKLGWVGEAGPADQG